MKKFLFAAAAAALAIGSAHGADLGRRAAPVYYKAPAAVPAAVYNWTGFYIGVNGGGAWGTTTGDELPTFFGGNHDISGGLVGGTVGYNYQVSNWVLGVEADWDWADLNGSRSSVAVPSLVESARVKDLGTVRGRIGYAWDRALLYGTGGFAWTDRMAVSCSGCGLTPDTHSLDGWTLGAGLEYGITPNLSAKAEYLFVHLDPGNYFVSQGCPGPCTIGANVNVVRAGLNWRLGFNGTP